jgi:hypothetical protein
VDAGEVLESVARQVFSGAKQIETPEGRVPVGKTPSKGLLRVEFSVEGHAVVGIEQNPHTASQWAKLAKAGHKVMQFRDAETGRYIANVVDGKVKFYGKKLGE